MGQSLKVYLPVDEKSYLEGLISKGSHPSRLLRRARILLLADRSGGTWNRYGKIAEMMHSDPSTVSNICRQYVLGGLEVALNEKPRPGRAPKITGEIEARLILLACSEPPEGQQRWTLKLLAGQLVELGLVDSISEVAIYKRLKKTNSNPGKSRPGAFPSPVRNS